MLGIVELILLVFWSRGLKRNIIDLYFIFRSVVVFIGSLGDQVSKLTGLNKTVFYSFCLLCTG